MVIGLGSDIVSVRRVSNLLARRPAFANRVLSTKEIAVYESRRRSPEHLAGRFAAKEAVLKAFGTGLRKGVLFSEIEITPGPLGEPLVNLRGRALEAFGKLRGTKILLSISHEKEYAVAFAIVEG